MKKRGFLLAEETLKMIIAVIVIIALMGLLAKLYYGYKNDKELEQAEATLERLKQEISSLEEGQTKTFEIYNPVDAGFDKDGDHWTLMSWPINGKLPKQCSTKGWGNCICICKNDKSVDYFEKNLIFKEINFAKQYSDKCDEIGVCVENQIITEVENRFVIKNNEENFIYLYGEVPYSIRLKKDSEKLVINK